MNNFWCYNPTKIIFGKGMISRIGNEIPDASRVLLMCGRESVRRNGVFDQLESVLAGRVVAEFSGVEPNPEYETCLAAIRLARESEADFVVAAGGGSVIDAAKFVSLALHHEGDEPWRLLTGEAQPPSRVVPLGCIQTLPASGSEMNNALVLSRRALGRKLSFSHIGLYPRFSVLDPEVMRSLTPDQMALGIVDMFVHVLEQYVTYPAGGYLQDRQAEALLLTIVESARIAIANPDDYDRRAAIMWCGAQAANGLISRGVPVDWATHAIGHELTAAFDLSHAQTLAVLLGGVYRAELSRKWEKLAQLGRRVFNLSGLDSEVAKRSIDCIDDFFESLGVRTRLESLGLDAMVVSDRIVERWQDAGFLNLGEHKTIDLDAVRQIVLSRA